MKIALIGYGKMGIEIEKIALKRNHQVVLTIDIHDQEKFNKENLSKADVAIEFSIPSSAIPNFKKCFEAGIPVVTGTTGWLDKYDEVQKECIEKKCGFFYSSNFSLGVNIFFEINKHLARLMNQYPDYEVSMEELHHIHKLDAPSGTAITLAEGIINNIERKTRWTKEVAETEKDIAIKSIRKDEIPGTHIISYDSYVDTIVISHEAKSRQGFALGAVLAAEFMVGKTGIYGMSDLLKL